MPYGSSTSVIKARKNITYFSSDVPDIMIGIYKSFARNRIRMCEIMSYFTTQR